MFELVYYYYYKLATWLNFVTVAENEEKIERLYINDPLLVPNA